MNECEEIVKCGC